MKEYVVCKGRNIEIPKIYLTNEELKILNWSEDQDKAKKFNSYYAVKAYMKHHGGLKFVTIFELKEFPHE